MTSSGNDPASGRAAGRGSRRGGEATLRTVLVAGTANIVVMVAKLAAGVMTGSSVMLAEGAHSFADTLNQVFLYTSVRQGERPADREHPFGYGQARYFWSLLAAFGIFVAGGGFSIFEGVLSMHEKASGFLIAYVVLGVSVAAEGTSFIRAVSQLRGEARRSHTELLDHVRTSRDTTVKAALFEDTAALIGLVLAAAGLGLQQLTGSPVYDGAASIAIGLLLVLVAIRLGSDSRKLLLGEAADPDAQRAIRDEIEHTPGVDGLLQLQTMHLGPDTIIVAARVDLADDATADQVENLADDIDRRLAERLPVTPYVFIDPTPSPAGAGRLTRPGTRRRPAS